MILAGVYDIKNLVRKLRQDEEHKVNSPWNIAADFGVEMSLTKEGIAGMLREYKADYQLLVIERFTRHFTDIYGHMGEKFVEKEGRK